VALYLDSTAVAGNSAPLDLVQAGKYFISIMADSTSKATIKLIFDDSLTQIVANTTMVVCQGPGTLGNLHKANGPILTWERDLTFVSGTAAASVHTNGTTTFKEIELKPVEILDDSSGATAVQYISLFGDTVSDQAADLNYSMEWFTESTTFGFKKLSGFSLPSTTLTVKIHDTIDNVLDDTTVGDYVTLIIATGDKYLFPQGFPDIFSGSYRVLTKSNAGSYDIITIDVPPSRDSYLKTTTSALSLSAMSCCVNLNKLIVTTSDGFEMPLRSRSGSAFTNVVPTTGQKCFANIRGVDYNSTCFQLSGWYANENGTQNVGSAVLDYTNFLTGTPPVIDYSKITGIEYASVLVSATKYPVPAPVKVGLAESLTDLALPMFSRDSLLTDVPLVQVGKRIVACINSTEMSKAIYGMYSSLWSGPLDALLECAPNEILLLGMNKDHTKYNLFPYPAFSAGGADFNWSCTGTGTEEFFDITKYDPSTEVVETVTVGTSFNENGSFFSDDKPNMITWTSSLNDMLGASVPQFEQGNMFELNTEDDSEILGGAVFQNALIVSKKNSLWHGTFDDDGSINFQRLQSPVGSYSHNNMPTTASIMYFIHPSGVYSYSNEGVLPVLKLNQLFQDKVSKNPDLLARTAGYVDRMSKQVYLGTPYLSDFIDNVGEVDGQFNYAYNDGVLGWQVNIGIDAYKWVIRNNQSFFASSRGRVFKMRTEPYLTKFRDGEDAIGSALVTRFLTGGETARFKFLRNVLFQFGGTSTFDFSTYYAVNYAPARTALETYPISGEVIEDGAKWYGNEKLLRSLRETLAQRVQSISFTLTEGSIDTDCPIYTVAVEGFETNTRLVRQKATPGERT